MPYSPEQPASKAVTLSPSDVESAKKLLRLLVAATETGPELAGLADTPAVSAEQLAARARLIISDRRKRARIFPPDMFGEPAWESLLLLYANERDARLTIGRLAVLSGAAKSSLLRWLGFLERHHFVERSSHPTDRRITFVSLTQSGRQKIERYLSETFFPDA